MSLQTFTHFPPPAIAPKRDYSYWTEEPSITRVLRAMGKEPMPYQRFIWAIGTEYRRDRLGRKHYHYSDVLVSTPRQSGKTTLLHPLRIYRMIDNDGAHLFSTAQSQKHASKRMLDMVQTVDMSLIGPLFRPRRGKGDAGLRLLANDADLAQFTPNEEAAHGETSPYFDFDEIWSFTQEQGQAILGGVRPSQITLHGRAQRWYTSTRGTAASTFMNQMLDDYLAGRRPTMAAFVWQKPENLDPYDVKTLWAFHPALGNTIDEAALVSEMDLPQGEFIRAYCNLLTEVEDTIMPLEDWEELARDFAGVTPPALKETTVAYDASPTNAAVVAVWITPEGRPVGKLLHQAPGLSWLEAYLANLADEHGVQTFWADGKGPSIGVTDRLIARGLKVRQLAFKERQLADLDLLGAARDDGTLIQDGSKALKIAIANAQTVTRTSVEMLDRDKSTAPIPSLIALSIGLYGATHPDAAFEPLVLS